MQWTNARKIDKAQLRVLHREGKSLRQIADVFGCSRERVRQVAVKMGLRTGRVSIGGRIFERRAS